MSDDAPFLLDVTRLIWRRWKARLPTGIDRVALAYLNHFAPRSQAVVQHDRFRRILGPRASQELFALLQAPRQSFKRDLITGTMKNFAHLGVQGRGRYYLNVGHTGLDSVGFRIWAQESDVRPIYLIHDLIPASHPEFARPGEDVRHRERMRTALITGSGIIGNSQATLDELAAFANSEALTMPPAVPAWLGIDGLPNTSSADRPIKPTFVTLGTIEARKNHELLLNVWSRLVSKFGDGAPQLLIIGQRGWEADEVFNRLDHDETLRGHVFELGNCSDQKLAKHFKSARALLFPSFAEGYGLPLIEALAAGLPAIASDLPVFKELAGSIPTYLDPRDEDAWEASIIDYAQDNSAVRKAQLQQLKALVTPRWPDHFSIVETWLKALA